MAQNYFGRGCVPTARRYQFDGGSEEFLPNVENPSIRNQRTSSTQWRSVIVRNAFGGDRASTPKNLWTVLKYSIRYAFRISSLGLSETGTARYRRVLRSSHLWLSPTASAFLDQLFPGPPTREYLPRNREDSLACVDPTGLPAISSRCRYSGPTPDPTRTWTSAETSASDLMVHLRARRRSALSLLGSKLDA